MRIDKENLMVLLQGYVDNHPRVIDLGGEYIMQNDDAQVDAVRLVCEIFDSLEG